MCNNVKKLDSFILVVGKTSGHLYQSELFREVLNIKDGPSPEVNLFNEKNNGLYILKLISNKLINAVHDVSSGGIILALSEMCMKGNIGAKIKVPKSKMSLNEYLFGEDQSRYIIEVDDKNIDEVSKTLDKSGIFYELIGKTQKESLEIDKEFSEKLNNLYKLNSFWFKNYFNEIK